MSGPQAICHEYHGPIHTQQLQVYIIDTFSYKDHRMSLEKRIAELRADVQSDRMSMSIGELAGLYEREELDIHPKFQRILRWSIEQRTRLIESILLRIPIPPIFVAQCRMGVGT